VLPFIAWTTLALAQDTTGTGALEGRLISTSGAAIPDARICATPARCATSNTDGIFRIQELRSGLYELEITLASRPPYRQKDVAVKPGLENHIEITLPELAAVKQELTVNESAFVAPEEVKSSSILVQDREIYKSAGALQDVSRYIQTLPGVTFGADDFRNDIIVRGGSPLENLYIVDNIEIPNINNFANFASSGGAVSMVDAALIQDVNFLSGGYPAPYINRLSSVLQITQREGLRDALHGRATLGFAGAGGIAEGPLGKGKGSWVVSARRSFLDFFTDDLGFGGVPVNYSFNGKALYDLTANDRIWAANISGIDSITIRPDASKTDQQTTRYNIDYSGWRTATGLNWQRLFGSRGVGLLGLTHSEASVESRIGDTLQRDRQVYNDNNREGESTLKYDLTLYASMLDKIQAGGSFKIFRINFRTAQPNGFDNPLDPAPGANPFFIDQSFRAFQSGAYFQSSRRFGSRVSLTWGGRFDNYQYIGRNRFSPRAGLSYHLTPKLTLRASYGTYFQQPFYYFLSAFPVNRGLIPSQSRHIVTGASYVVSNTLRMTLEAYQKDYKDYPVSLQYRTYTLANAGDTFAIQNYIFPLTSAGRGKARGIEFFMEKKFTNKWYGQMNLAYSRSRHAGLDQIYRRGSFDSPLIFNTVGGYRFNAKWEVSARVVFVDGRPYTPLDTTLSLAQNRRVLDTAQANGVRAPDYFRFDFRIDRTFTVRDKPLLVFLGLQNATNRKNFQGVNWNPYTRSPQVQEQQGVFPLIGLDWRF